MKGKLLAEGKTKKIHEATGLVVIESKDDITAGDGAKHDVVAGKAEHSTQTTCNVFELLQRHNIPVAYLARYSKTEFLALNCRMLPFEVVIRGLALGSYLKRHPEVEKGTRFDPPIVEFYLKTKERVFNNVALPKDDPLITDLGSESVFVHDPSIPTEGHGLHVPLATEDRLAPHLHAMGQTAIDVFAVLQAAWQRLGHTLADLKIEFGITPDGRLVVADVIDNDSWRLLTADGVHLDKQRYRDGTASLEKVSDLYSEIAQRSTMLLQY